MRDLETSHLSEFKLTPGGSYGLHIHVYVHVYDFLLMFNSNMPNESFMRHDSLGSFV